VQYCSVGSSWVRTINVSLQVVSAVCLEAARAFMYETKKGNPNTLYTAAYQVVLGGCLRFKC